MLNSWSTDRTVLLRIRQVSSSNLSRRPHILIAFTNFSQTVQNSSDINSKLTGSPPSSSFLPNVMVEGSAILYRPGHCLSWLRFLRDFPKSLQKNTGIVSPISPRQLPSINKTPWFWSASELYRPSDRRLSAKLVPTLADRGCHVVSATKSTAVNFGFLDQSRYFLETAPQLPSWGWVDPVPDALLLRKIWQSRESNPDLWICSQEL
jgi:hypothetical protein